MEANLSLVADLGRTFARIGYSGDDKPRILSESYLAVSAETQSLNGEIDQTTGLPPPTKVKLITGEKLHGFNPGFTYEPLWQNGSMAANPRLGELFSSEILPSLNLESKSLPLLLSEDNAVTKEDRKALLNTFLEGNVVSHLMMMRQSLLSLYACGKINGAVIDSSSLFTSVSTIEEGYFVTEGFVKIPYGGEIMTDKIYDRLPSDSKNILPETLRNEDLDLTTLDPSYFDFERRNLARRIKHALLSTKSRLVLI